MKTLAVMIASLGMLGASCAQAQPMPVADDARAVAPALERYAQGPLTDLWQRPGLSRRDRSLVTITALVAGGNTEQLPFHLQLGRQNGLTESEVVEAITHLAFYTGWPRAMSAITAAKQTFAA